MNNIVSDSWVPDDHIPPQLSNEEKVELRDRIRTRCKFIESTFIDLAEDLYTIKRTSVYVDWGYASFDHYIENELNLRSRQVLYYCKVYHTLICEYGIKREDLKDLGITKAKFICSVITEENVQDLLADAKENKLKALEKKYGESIEVGDEYKINPSSKKITVKATDTSAENFSAEEEYPSDLTEEESDFVEDDDISSIEEEPKETKKEITLDKDDVIVESSEEIPEEFSFDFNYDSKEHFDSINESLELAKEVFKTDSDEVALLSICMFFKKKINN